MSSLQISVLLISAFIIVMVLATIFKRQQRTVLWSSAILIFTGTLILIGVGVIKLIKNNQPDFCCPNRHHCRSWRFWSIGIRGGKTSCQNEGKG